MKTTLTSLLGLMFLSTVLIAQIDEQQSSTPETKVLFLHQDTLYYRSAFVCFSEDMSSEEAKQYLDSVGRSPYQIDGYKCLHTWMVALKLDHQDSAGTSQGATIEPLLKAIAEHDKVLYVLPVLPLKMPKNTPDAKIEKLFEPGTAMIMFNFNINQNKDSLEKTKAALKKLDAVLTRILMMSERFTIATVRFDETKDVMETIQQLRALPGVSNAAPDWYITLK